MAMGTPMAHNVCKGANAGKEDGMSYGKTISLRRRSRRANSASPLGGLHAPGVATPDEHHRPCRVRVAKIRLRSASSGCMSMPAAKPQEKTTPAPTGALAMVSPGGKGPHRLWHRCLQQSWAPLFESPGCPPPPQLVQKLAPRLLLNP